ncbi:hypothetical protein BXZ70DRAFT_548262 [Cristinia sonorae]|uniref:Uncharacterized protein n=1 Tax=Cristinia sonorae TaxID=1940300 RepID=A0A8K0UFS0_9AGAR|nr:hypothetical protein BXZ70DRAFT_548262 [Cristinia sonorae]
MWCTRWYLPLVLLPLPIAPPFFLALFLLSLTLHARPCFYCIVLLTALFLSTCYWPPVPIETPLSTPWADNITTYADALFSLMPNLPKELVPADIPIVDHCWCDLTSGRFFEPFDVTRWEVQSVVRMKEELEELQILNAKIDAAEAEREGEEGSEEMVAAKRQNSTVTGTSNRTATMFSWSAILASRWPIFKTPSPSSLVESATSSSTPQPTSEPPHNPTTPTTPQAASSMNLPRIRREYDLRPYGFEMVVDFGWSRNES